MPVKPFPFALPLQRGDQQWTLPAAPKKGAKLITQSEHIITQKKMSTEQAYAQPVYQQPQQPYVDPNQQAYMQQPPQQGYVQPQQQGYAQPPPQQVYVQTQPVAVQPQQPQQQTTVVTTSTNAADAKKKESDLAMALIVFILIFIFFPCFIPCALFYIIWVAMK